MLVALLHFTIPGMLFRLGVSVGLVPKLKPTLASKRGILLALPF